MNTTLTDRAPSALLLVEQWLASNRFDPVACRAGRRSYSDGSATIERSHDGYDHVYRANRGNGWTGWHQTPQEAWEAAL